MFRIKHNHSFTLIELIAVVIIIAIIAGFAIPNYRKTVERAHLKDALNNLTAIHAANVIRNSENGRYWPEDGSAHNVTDINTNLRLNVIEQGVTYSCISPAGDGSNFTCTGTRTIASNFVATVTEAALSTTNPQCTSNCP